MSGRLEDGNTARPRAGAGVTPAVDVDERAELALAGIQLKIVTGQRDALRNALQRRVAEALNAARLQKQVTVLQTEVVASRELAEAYATQLHERDLRLAEAGHLLDERDVRLAEFEKLLRECNTRLAEFTTLFAEQATHIHNLTVSSDHWQQQYFSLRRRLDWLLRRSGLLAACRLLPRTVRRFLRDQLMNRGGHG